MNLAFSALQRERFGPDGHHLASGFGGNAQQAGRLLGIVHVVMADEPGHKFGLGQLVQLLRRTLLSDDAAVHHAHAVGDGHGLLLIVGDENGGDVHVLLDLANLHAQVLTDLGVQGGERLVQKQHLGLHHQGAGQGYALLLTARKLAGTLIFLAL